MLELLKLPKKEVDELRKKKDLLEVKIKSITKGIKDDLEDKDKYVFFLYFYQNYEKTCFSRSPVDNSK